MLVYVLRILIIAQPTIFINIIIVILFCLQRFDIIIFSEDRLRLKSSIYFPITNLTVYSAKIYFILI